MGGGQSRIRTETARDKARQLIERNEGVFASDNSIQSRIMTAEERGLMIDAIVGRGSRATRQDLSAEARDAVDAIEAAHELRRPLTAEEAKRVAKAFDSPYVHAQGRCPGRSGDAASLLRSHGRNAGGGQGQTGDGSGVPLPPDDPAFTTPGGPCYDCDCSRANCPECSACNFMAQ